MRIDDITIGHALPKLPVPITVSLVAGGAIATRGSGGERDIVYA